MTQPKNFKPKFKTILSVITILFFQLSLHAQSVDALIESGNKAYGEKKFSEAQQFYESALSTKAGVHPQAIFNLGNALFQQKKFREAEKQFSTFLKTQTDVSMQSQAFYNLGNCYFEMKNYQSAIIAYQKALRLNPADEDARYNLALSVSILASANPQSKTSVKNQPSGKPEKEPISKPLTEEEQKQLLDQLNKAEQQTLNQRRKTPSFSTKKVLKDW